MICHVQLHATLDIAKRHDGADVLLRHEQLHGHDRFANRLHPTRVRQLVRVVDDNRLAAAQQHFIHHRRRGGDQIHVELALEPFLHDIHVQQAEKAAAEAKAQRLRNLGLILQ